jgi:hypothetical protein
MMSRLVASGGAFRHWQEKDDRDEKATVEALQKTLDNRQSRAVPDGSVWTFNVSPDSGYGTGCGFTHATTGVLSLNRAFAKWKMELLKTEVE